MRKLCFIPTVIMWCVLAALNYKSKAVIVGNFKFFIWECIEIILFNIGLDNLKFFALRILAVHANMFFLIIFYRDLMTDFIHILFFKSLRFLLHYLKLSQLGFLCFLSKNGAIIFFFNHLVGFEDVCILYRNLLITFFLDLYPQFLEQLFYFLYWLK